MNYAERHNIEIGDFVEVITTPFGQEQTRVMRFQGTSYRSNPGGFRETFYSFYSTRRVVYVKERLVRSFRKLTPEQAAQTYYVGQRVIVAKYGSDYHAEVTKVGRRRITVKFTTMAGREKVAILPLEDLVAA